MNIQPTPFETWQQPPGQDELRLIPIGGHGEFGMNALVVHTARTLILVDCGQLFPSEDQPGIDSVIPDFAYLEPFAEHLNAVLLTHGHEDHVGALPYLLERWPVPVYGTRLTLGILKHKLTEHEIKGVELREVKDFDRLPIGDGEIEAEWIPVTHSIPDACALALHTPMGVVLNSGDYKLDPTPLDGRLTGIKRLKELGKKGVRLMLADSTNVITPGKAPSEAVCREGFEAAFQRTSGRLVVATFSSQIHRIQTLLDLAYDNNRKIVLVGRSLERNVQLSRELGLLRLPDELIEARDAHYFKPEQILVICTGAQGEPLSGLARMVRGEVKGLRLEEGDRLVISARVIPGNEVSVARILDDAARLGVETYSRDLGPVHATGHAYQDDAVELMGMVRPTCMVPAHGTYRNLRAHGLLAKTLGWPKDKIFLLDGGRCLQLFQDGRERMAGSVPVGKCFVDQGVSHWVDARVIHDRLILQEEGIVVATLLVDPETLELVDEPKIVSRGFVVLSDDESYGELLRRTARQAYEEAPMEIRRDPELCIELLRQALRRIIRKTTQTRPLVVPLVIEAPKEG